MCVRLARKKTYSPADLVKASIIVGFQNCQNKESLEEFLRKQQDATVEFFNVLEKNNTQNDKTVVSHSNKLLGKRMSPEVKLEEKS
jgi:hypothetical protein